MTSIKKLGFFIVFLALSGTPESHAAPSSTDQRIQELENRINSLQQTYITNNQDVASAVAKAETLQREALSLQGVIESNRHEFVSEQKELEMMLNDINLRLKVLEERINIFSSQMNLALKKIAPELGGESEAYQKGLSLLQENNYLEAITQFQALLKKYPKGSLAPLAQYWIGESYFNLRDFQRAIKEYQAFIEKYLKHERVKAALLKQGISFMELSMFDEARPFFEKVINNYPKTEEAVEAQARLGRLQKGNDAAALPSVAPQTETIPPSSYPEKTIEEERKEKNSTLEY